MLFLEDWEKAKLRGYDPFIDYNTKNESFLRTAELLQKMGVENHYFCLGTMNKELEGIDPHDKKLCNMLDPSSELLKLRALILDECINNIWYFFREVSLVRVSGAANRVNFRLNRGSVATFWLLENHIDTYLELPRQIGKTFGSAGFLARCIGLASTNGNYGILSKDRNLTGDYAKYLENFLTGLPPYMTFRHKFDKCNSEMVTVKKMENQVHLMVCQSNKEDALNVGRGLALNGIIIDEGNFQDNLDITLPSLLTTGNAAKENAKRNNAPYFTLMTSTAGDLNTSRGKYGRKLFDQSLPFTERFYDLKDEEELRETIRRNNLARLKQNALENNDDPDAVMAAPTRVRVSFGYKAMGLTDAWYNEKKVELGFTEERAQNELNNVWLKNSGSKILSPEESKALNDGSMDVVYMEITEDNYIINWYVPEEEVLANLPRRQMVMGVDPSNALGGDSFPFIILDTDTAETLAIGFYKQTNLASLNEWFVKWFIRFPENFIMIIENRSSGTVLIDTIVKELCSMGINPLTKIFNWVVDEMQDIPKQKENFNESFKKLHDLSFFAYLKRELGFTTSSGNSRSGRNKLFQQALRNYLTNAADVCRDKTIISEWHTLTDKNGKIEAEIGTHDDTIVALLLAYWFLLYAKNKHRYGLDTNRILNKALYKNLGEEGAEKYQRNQLVVSKIEEMKKMLNNSANDLEKEYYMRQIEKQAHKIGVETEGDTLNIDQKLNTLQDKRKREMSNNALSLLSRLAGRRY